MEFVSRRATSSRGILKSIGSETTHHQGKSRLIITEELSSKPSRKIALYSWRRAEYPDVKDIEELLPFQKNRLYSLFNYPKIHELIEKSYFPIVQFDYFERIVSFTACQCYPNIPAVLPGCWVEWLHELYDFSDANARNSLFIHYMVWDPHLQKDFLRLLLETILLEFVHIRYIIIVKPPFAKLPGIYEEYFVPVLPCKARQSQSSIDRLQSLHVCQRSSVVKRLHIRKAAIEDSDSLTSLFRTSEHKFETFYGEFFFAELIQFPGAKDRQVFVSELEGTASGVMCINLDVDLEYLNEEFELMPYHGLRKQHKDDSLLSFLLDSIDERTGNAESLIKIDSEDLNVLYSSSPVESTLSDWFRGEEWSSSSSSYLDLQISEWARPSISRCDMISRMEETVTAGLKDPFRGHATLSKGWDDVQEMTCGLEENPSLPQISTIPRYKGSSNAFAIELFAIDYDKVDERLTIDFLEAAFGMAKDRDYCIITIPSQLLPIPLLNHFVRVPPRPSKQCMHELYVCHKNAVSGLAPTVRPVLISDLNSLKNMLMQVHNYDVVFSDLEKGATEGKLSSSFVLTDDGEIVGLALLCQETGTKYLPIFFDLIRFTIPDMHENQSVLKHFFLAQQYHAYTSHFLMELMRIADVSMIYHPCSDPMLLRGTLVTVLGDLQPLMPRKVMNTELVSKIVEEHSSETLNFGRAFSLFFTTSQLCSTKKNCINYAIVVVGASDTACSFLETLIFRSSERNIQFSNLIWIFPKETGDEMYSTELRDFMFPIQSKYDKDYRIKLGIKYHVQLVNGYMTEINRDKKYVLIDQKRAVRYDLLILALGIQYCFLKPERIKQHLPALHLSTNTKYLRSSLSRYLVPECLTVDTQKVFPVNMFIINTYLDAYDAITALRYLRKNVQSGDRKVIVYGHNLCVFMLLQTLLIIGIPSELIAFVEPFPDPTNSISIFTDTTVDKAVLKSIKNLKISHYKEYFFHNWTISERDRIINITFHSSTRQITLDCLVFIPLHQKRVAEINQKICTKAGLVFDGKLIINRDFKTNDDFIYAAGPFTKYSRRYYSPDSEPRYFNSTEIGAKLADVILQETVSWSEEMEMSESKHANVLLPRFKEPVMAYCHLPGGFYYFTIKKPGKSIIRETQLNFGDFGDCLVTGDCEMQSGRDYFKIHLDETGCVEEITCYSKETINYERLSALYGMNEKLLNNMLQRYDRLMIRDFYEYFSEPWADVLFHNDFQKLLKLNLELFKSGKHSGRRQSIFSDVEKLLRANNYSVLSDRLIKALEVEYKKSLVVPEIERNVLEFLSFYNVELTSYATDIALKTLIPTKSNFPKSNEIM